MYALFVMTMVFLDLVVEKSKLAYFCFKSLTIMILGFLKSLLFMLIFVYFIRLLGYVFKFVYYFNNKSFNNRAQHADASIIKDSALKMLQCEKCRVYVAKSEAYVLGGKIFCKKEHSL